MGRPKKPTALAAVKGGRTDRINDREPVPSMGEVLPPDWLTELGLDYWKRYAPDLVAKHVLTRWDVEAFAEWCDARATIEMATVAIDDQGHLVEIDVFDRNGKPTGTRVVPNPWEMIKRAALEVSGKRAARFGLTPSDRAAVTVGDSGGSRDEAQNYLRRG